jgi:hypothetical protein
MDLRKDQVELQVHRWEEGGFVGGRPTAFRNDGENWQFAGRKEEEGVPAIPFEERAE